MSEVRVPEGWESIELKQACNIVMGQSPDGIFINQSNNGFPFLQGNAEFSDIYPIEKNWTTNITRTAKQNSLLLSVRAPVGELNIADKDYCIGRGLSSLNSTTHSLDYLYFYINHKKNQFSNLSQGSTFEAVNRKNIEEFTILSPKLKKEQQKIAEILSEVDSAITLTKELIEKNKRLKTALMQDLLSYGIAEETPDGRFDENGQIRTPQTHKFKPSPLGDIPVEWECVELGNIYKDLRTGSTPSRSNPAYFKGDILWVTSGELKYKVITNTVEKITKKAVKDTNLKIYPSGTFFIAITGLEAKGTRGSCAIISKEATTNQSCMAFEENEKVNTLYLFQYYLLHGENISLYYSQGSKQQSLNNKIVSKIPIHLPSLLEQQKIANILSSQDEKIEKLSNKLTKLNHLKTSLMQDLLSGKVRVNKLLESK